ncbi:MaoC family dehydratase N-terminal domain-containing protein [Cytobacillus sp. FSL W8-0315]|uniref:FAS1-like dehydratase domain-containing protein n=1 Tax=Cytobacillus TaxID=2675230 RepID=UPI00203DF128|nr:MULTISPECIES: MaoC family dehydratase N-terminal domain-containing protein [Cytobacillus]MBY0156129.1 MaoC family dehydratase N-terminal domain-containing protein [Cytobacillus firmus]MCM3395531.1 MaoC family dehydratase N-terminal domain-containing protein [Cytobacillus oceanisediminis]UQX55676.1 MaoC family dehydratase N-terminal domain-containing protein [Cytobacillus pseudoceanisediminis]
MESLLKEDVKLKPFRFTIERGKIKEFAMAIGDRNPIYFDADIARKEGYRDIPIPPTFPTAIEMWGGLDFETLISLFGLDPLKVLHGGQEYRYMGELCAGDTITAAPQLISAFEKRNLRFITIGIHYKNSEGIKVLYSESTIIERRRTE